MTHLAADKLVLGFYPQAGPLCHHISCIGTCLRQEPSWLQEISALTVQKLPAVLTPPEVQL